MAAEFFLLRISGPKYQNFIFVVNNFLSMFSCTGVFKISGTKASCEVFLFLRFGKKFLAKNFKGNSGSKFLKLKRKNEEKIDWRKFWAKNSYNVQFIFWTVNKQTNFWTNK